MHFLDDEDNEVMQKELKEAFRLYDKDGEYKGSSISLTTFIKSSLHCL
jgi:Ca2+-binding EF-hand superfamily protein